MPTEDFVTKIRAAADARHDPDFVIIARTDARAVAGFDEAIKRANAALAAGADVAFVEAPQSLEEVAAVPKAVDGPCLLNIVHGGKTPFVDPSEAEAMGYRITIIPALLMSAVVDACDKVLGKLRKSGRMPTMENQLSIGELFRRCGSDEWDPRRTKYRDPDDSAAPAKRAGR